jgi:hypothetical protein
MRSKFSLSCMHLSRRSHWPDQARCSGQSMLMTTSKTHNNCERSCDKHAETRMTPARSSAEIPLSNLLTSGASSSPSDPVPVVPIVDVTPGMTTDNVVAAINSGLQGTSLAQYGASISSGGMVIRSAPVLSRYDAAAQFGDPPGTDIEAFGGVFITQADSSGNPLDDGTVGGGIAGDGTGVSPFGGDYSSSGSCSDASACQGLITSGAAAVSALPVVMLDSSGNVVAVGIDFSSLISVVQSWMLAIGSVVVEIAAGGVLVLLAWVGLRKVYRVLYGIDPDF